MPPWTLVSFIGLAFLVWFVLVVLFSPRIDYHLTTPLDSERDLLHVLQATCQSPAQDGNRVEVLTNGAQFYPAMHEAIVQAQHSINIEAYIFEPGRVGDQLADAIIERARAGVDVRIVLDALGSRDMRRSDTAIRLTAAGCRLDYYQPLTWYRLHRANNRTHRELLIVDGRVAFAGGAGVADWWLAAPSSSDPSWRDTMVRMEGPVVASLQGVFAENWLECGGEILTSAVCWPRLEPAGPATALLIKSSPSDRATSSRVAFQLLIEFARTSVDISTPYFLPDRALRRSLIAAARRGVRVRVIVPGAHTDQRLVRLASRRLYHRLLEAGVHIHEYQPGMTHVKTLMIDDGWCVIGTTNFDNRSFEHNDEVNVAFTDADVTARLRVDFNADLGVSTEVTFDDWRARPLWEKMLSPLSWILERQQ